MPFNSVEQTHKKLAENLELSEYNREILDEFFHKMRTGITGKATGENTLQSYASWFNTLAPHIEFKLDQPSLRDLENIVGKINSDEVTKQNGEPYSDYSKQKLEKTFSVFYKSFIDKKGKGFNEEIDGKDLMEDLEIRYNIDHNIDLDTRPTPQHVLAVAEEANSLRDTCLILFGWATGARNGEIAKTREQDQYPEPIKWKDIKFKDREMHVTLRGKTGERTIPIRVAMPKMKKLYNEESPDLEDPVFNQMQPSLFCPKCESRVSSERKTGYDKRTYNCNSEDCSWSGGHQDCLKKRKPMWDSDVRKQLKRALKKAKEKERVPHSITHRPHWFFRDGRALYWAAKDQSENFLRGFFGWSSTSDAPKHYIELMQESVLAGVREDFDEELSDEERRF